MKASKIILASILTAFSLSAFALTAPGDECVARMGDTPDLYVKNQSDHAINLISEGEKSTVSGNPTTVPLPFPEQKNNITLKEGKCDNMNLNVDIWKPEITSMTVNYYNVGRTLSVPTSCIRQINDNLNARTQVFMLINGSGDKDKAIRVFKMGGTILCDVGGYKDKDIEPTALIRFKTPEVVACYKTARDTIADHQKKSSTNELDACSDDAVNVEDCHKAVVKVCKSDKYKKFTYCTAVDATTTPPIDYTKMAISCKK